MTDYQNELVMEHLDLVNWVIRTRISVPNRPLSGHSPDSAQISTVLQTGQLSRHDRQR